MQPAVNSHVKSTETSRSDPASRDRLSIDPAVLTGRTSLRLPPKLPFAAWQRVGRQLYLISDSSAWWLGDWLVFGEENFPDRYRHVVAETGLSYGTLRNYAWVARRFEVSRRHDKLSFQHHYEVAALSETEQDLWLTMAAGQRWSKTRLRAELRATRAYDVEQSTVSTVHFRVTTTQQRQELWQKAADLSGRDLLEWISLELDESAQSVIGASEPASSG
ncbi:LmbU family transcriptional regulator [Actinomadura coerulea]|uniref:LmbU family transcriptional regulator n=1 Tax=Actinomadura coerulea TaxID=46159 RepID=UPI003425773A